MGRREGRAREVLLFVWSFLPSHSPGFLLYLLSPAGSVSVSAEDSRVEAPSRTLLPKGSHTVPQTSAPQTSLSNLMIGRQKLFGDWLEARCLGRFSVK